MKDIRCVSCIFHGEYRIAVKNNQLHLGVVVIFLLYHLLEEHVAISCANLSVAASDVHPWAAWQWRIHTYPQDCWYVQGLWTQHRHHLKMLLAVVFPLSAKSLHLLRPWSAPEAWQQLAGKVETVYHRHHHLPCPHHLLDIWEHELSSQNFRPRHIHQAL